ncbi:hypothetical protein BDW74DRAFT_178021 [Aspergillus multicolor]|uniref:F-box protein n=1 Tax=Aspergillus multicolor TaxID=41759 RepID=UPI003CCE31CA
MSLSSLPNELLVLITDYLSQHDLNSIAQTNHHLYNLLLRRLYRIDIRTHYFAALHHHCKSGHLHALRVLFASIPTMETSTRRSWQAELSAYVHTSPLPNSHGNIPDINPMPAPSLHSSHEKTLQINPIPTPPLPKDSPMATLMTTPPLPNFHENTHRTNPMPAPPFVPPPVCTKRVLGHRPPPKPQETTRKINPMNTAIDN